MFYREVFMEKQENMQDLMKLNLEALIHKAFEVNKQGSKHLVSFSGLR